MSLKTPTITVVVSIIVLGSLAGAIHGGSEHFDACILAELYIRTLDLIIEENYGRVLGVTSDLVEIELPSNIVYLHKKVYSELAKVIEDLRVLDSLEEKLSVLAELNKSSEYNRTLEIFKELVIEFYGDRLRLEPLLRRYVDVLVKHVDPSLATYYRDLLVENTDRLFEHLDRKLDHYIAIAGKVPIAPLEAVSIELTNVPEYVVAGSYMNLSIRLAVLNRTVVDWSNCTLVLRVWYGYLYVEEYRFSVVLDKVNNVSFKTLDAEEVIDKRLPVEEDPDRGVYYVEVYGVVYCTVTRGGKAVVVGRNMFYSTLLMYKPMVSIEAPSTVYYGEDLLLKIMFNGSGSLAAHVYIDGKHVGELVIHNGTTYYAIPSGLLAKGVQTISLELEPKGKYMGCSYTITVLVRGRTLDAILGSSRVVFQPFSRLRVKGIVAGKYADPGELHLTVLLDGKPVYNGTVPESFDIELGTPFTLLSLHKITIIVSPSNSVYDPVVAEATAVVVNVPLILTLPISMAIVLATGVLYDITLLIHGLRQKTRAIVQRGSMPLRRDGSWRGISFITIRFRESRIALLYWSLVSKLSKVLHRPYPYETLREYYARVNSRLRESVRRLFRDLTLLVEKDLYSRERVDEDYFKNLVKRVENEIR